MIAVSDDRSTTHIDAEWHPMQPDHRALGVSAERLDKLLAGLATGGSSSGSTVWGLLEEFCRRLVSHLDAEEQSGILELAAEHEPRFARRIEQLLREHDLLRRGANALAAGPEGSDWQGFRARFVEFRSVLVAHEQAENDVLHGAYSEDIGGRG